MPKKIAITGPESSGKTTLAQILAKHYSTIWVPEFARTYLSALNRPYDISDLSIIAEGQQDWESLYRSKANSILICDTDMTVLKVWSEYRFGYCEKKIQTAFEQQKYDLTLLCRPDFDWEPDPLRENPNDREYLFEQYIQALEQKNVQYIVLSGSPQERINKAISSIAQLTALL